MNNYLVYASVASSVFTFVGVGACYVIINEIKENIFATRQLISDYITMRSNIENEKHRLAKIWQEPDLTFEHVMCGGCGQSVKTGDDGFTPGPHECDYLKNFSNRD